MSLPSYPDYKDSGVAWLGRVPKDWSIGRLDALTETHRNSITPEELSERTVFHYSIPVVQQIGSGQFEDGSEIDSNKLVISSTQLLVSKLNPHKQTMVMAHAESECLTIASTEFVPLLPKSININYLYYVWASSFALNYLLSRCDSATRSHQRVKPDDISKMNWAWPSVDEQTAIATFLDRETAKIDALIAEQEKLLTLLAEKRQATISHAVTKGLNPDAPMKDSGVAWLGEVPAHWEVCAMRRILVGIQQGWSPECENRAAADDEWGVLKAGCVNRGKYDATENKALPPELQPIPAYEIHAGDLLMSRASGSPQLVGSVAYIRETRAKLMLSDKIFRLKTSANAEFIAWLYNSQAIRAQIEQAISGADGLANNLPQSSMKSFFIPLPPQIEQDTIVQFLEDKINHLDALTTETTRAIDLLKERRTALISAAVTGKIDVRGLVKMEAA